MIKELKQGDLLITNNFTLKQDIYILKEDGLKNLGRYNTDELFKKLNNLVREYKMYKTENNIFMKRGAYIPDSFEHKSLIKTY